VQTRAPEHPSLVEAARHDYAAFAANELAFRKDLGYPPFGRLVAFGFAGTDEERVIAAAHQVAASVKDALAAYEAQAKERKAATAGALDVLGPAPSPMARLRGKHRWRLTLKDRDTSASTPSPARPSRPPRALPGACPSGVLFSVGRRPVRCVVDRATIRFASAAPARPVRLSLRAMDRLTPFCAPGLAWQTTVFMGVRSGQGRVASALRALGPPPGSAGTRIAVDLMRRGARVGKGPVERSFPSEETRRGLGIGALLLAAGAAHARNFHCAGGVQYVIQGMKEKDKGITSDAERIFNKAVVQLNQCTTEDPKDAEAWGYMGWAYGELDSATQAGKAFEVAVEKFKDDPKGLKRWEDNRKSYWVKYYNSKACRNIARRTRSFRSTRS
jgi:hypothetical protein